MPNLYVIAGCNGAGKTTASYTVLPEVLNCKEFVNADEIAKGISPFQPDKVAIEAGRIMLNRIKDLTSHGSDFAFETTLATKSYKQFIKDAQLKGYFVTLLFFWLNSPELAIERVKSRVSSGGHDIPIETIRRRYYSGMDNLSKLYLPICDYWMIIDNSVVPYKVIAEGSKDINADIYNQDIYNKIIIP
ncbi:MAG TPA: zeta toxin family protein [Prolixibacteraceae bacterium]|nr:zeta toxin family protein [Prolixibacteraceae bacterium]